VKGGSIVAGLDLGSTKTCAVIAQVTGGERDFGAKVLGVGISRETGVRGGLVRDIEETTRSITAAMRDAQRMAGVPVPPIYCGIGGDHVQLCTSPWLVSVTGDEITKGDVQRVDAVATAITLAQDRELLHSIPREYRVDGQEGISDPVGMTGLRLEVEMYLVSVVSAAAQNVRKSVERAGFRLAQLVFEPLASSLSVLSAEEREIGCALVDVGGNTTGLAVIRGDRIRHIASLPYAGDRITSDIVQGLGVTQSDAERLKDKWGVAYTPLVDPDETIELPSTPGQGVRQAKRELLAHIIHQRLDEILGLVHREIVDGGLAEGLPAGVVLCGGIPQMRGVVELAREVFAMPAQTGTPTRRISGLVDSVASPRYAVASGLVLYAARESIGRGERGTFGGNGFLAPIGYWFDRTKRWFDDFF